MTVPVSVPNAPPPPQNKQATARVLSSLDSQRASGGRFGICKGEKEARPLAPVVPQGKQPCLLRLTWKLQKRKEFQSGTELLCVDGCEDIKPHNRAALHTGSICPPQWHWGRFLHSDHAPPPALRLSGTPKPCKQSLPH